VSAEARAAADEAAAALKAARDTTDVAREVVDPAAARLMADAYYEGLLAGGRPCSWGDQAWHRAVNRLTRIHGREYRRLLAQERGERPSIELEVDDDEFPLPGQEPPDPPDEV
jgi:hypothetical protein